MNTMKKYVIECGIWLFVFGLFVLFLRETQAYLLFSREQQQLFLFDEFYLSDLMRQVGGGAVVMARYVVQFFYSLWLGPLLTALLLVVIAILIMKLMRNVGASLFLLPISLLPVAFLAISLFDKFFRYEGVTAYGLAVFALLLYSREYKHVWIYRGIGIVSTIFLFCFAGSVALLFSVSAFVFDLIKRRDSLFVSLLYPVVALVCGGVAVCLGSIGVYAPAFTPVAYYEPMIAMPWIHYVAWCLLPICEVLVGLLNLVSVANRWLQVGLAMMLAIVGSYFGYGCAKERLIGDTQLFSRYEYQTIHGQWKELQKTAYPYTETYQGANYLNLSLAEQGRLVDDLFCFAQHGPMSLIYIPNDKTPDFRLAHILFAMGNMGAAQNVAFNASYGMCGYNPTMLKMVLQIDLMRGAYDVALKYIELLEKSWHYADWATGQRKFLHDDRAVEQDPILGNGRRDFPKEEAFVLLNSPMDDLYRILDTNPSDKKSMQYALAFLLLAKDINSVRSFIDRYYGSPGLKSLPIAAQEALLFYSDYYHTLTEEYALQHGMSKEQLIDCQRVDLDYCRAHGVAEETIDRFGVFKETYGRTRQSAEALGSYRNTFWYYLLFAQI